MLDITRGGREISGAARVDASGQLHRSCRRRPSRAGRRDVASHRTFKPASRASSDVSLVRLSVMRARAMSTARYEQTDEHEKTIGRSQSSESGGRLTAWVGGTNASTR